MEDRFYVVNGEILQDVIKKVVEVKELLHKGMVKDITEGVKTVGISRSAYYKYKDKVFPLTEGAQSQKATIALLISHDPGVLSMVLDTIAANNGNVLTINQDLPINNSANVTITLDISSLNTDIRNVMNILGENPQVLKTKLIAMQ
ncbi:ACT domain-containing protein [Clostridium polynesiense]|uniref:ACT domain-containing protein n=1 Tax=Clostridium polynesiense TaxID=1325933 RepID=UPI0006941D26|nr:ACT domain-containing protein [Clostridium polynesiense]